MSESKFEGIFRTATSARALELCTGSASVFFQIVYLTEGSPFTDKVAPISSENLNSCMSVSSSTRFSYLSRRTRIHLPVIPVSAHEQFRQNLYSLIRSTLMADQPQSFKPKEVKGLKKIPPYWYPYTTMTKLRWIGRELLEVVSTEFRDRSMEYYVRQNTLVFVP